MDQGTHSTVLAGNANLASALRLRAYVQIPDNIWTYVSTHHLEGIVVGDVEFGGGGLGLVSESVEWTHRGRTIQSLQPPHTYLS